MKQLVVLFLACALLFCVIRTDANCGGKACCRSKQAKEVPKSVITYEVYEDAPNCNRAFNDIQLAIDTAVAEVQPTQARPVHILIYGARQETDSWIGVEGTDIISIPDFVYMEGVGPKVSIHASLQYNMVDIAFFKGFTEREYEDTFFESHLKNLQVKGPSNGLPFPGSTAKPAIVLEGPLPLLIVRDSIITHSDVNTPIADLHGLMFISHSVTAHNGIFPNLNASGEHFHLHSFGGVSSYYSLHYWFSTMAVTKGPNWGGLLLQHSMFHSHPIGFSLDQVIDKILIDVQHPVTIPGQGLLGPWNENACHFHAPNASVRFIRIGPNGTFGSTSVSGNAWQVSGEDVQWIENQNPNYNPKITVGDTFTSLGDNSMDFYGTNIEFSGGVFQAKEDVYPETRIRQVSTYTDNNETIKLKRGTARLDGVNALILTLVDADQRYENEMLSLLDVSGHAHVINTNGFRSDTGAAFTTLSFDGTHRCRIRLDNVDNSWYTDYIPSCVTVA